MELNKKGRLITRCAMDLLTIKQELLDVGSCQPSEATQRRVELLEERKHHLLRQIDALTSGSAKPFPDV